MEQSFHATGRERLKRLAGSAKHAARGALVRLLQVALFNPVCLRCWLWILRGRVEFFGTSHAIGEMVTTVDYYLKRKLHLQSRMVSVYLINKPHLANAYLAKVQARAFRSPRTLFVSNRFLCLLLAPLEHQLSFTGPHRTFSPHAQEYHELNDRYNFHLERQVTAAERERARLIMERFGLPREAKFVCVHVREAGFSARVQSPGHNAIRNADVMTYRAAIEYLVRQGFWVVRMGEATVTPLPPMERVIDYARSPCKSAFMDIVLVAEGEFYVGSSAGLVNVAYIFNKFILMANALPLESAAWHPRHFWIPKLLYSTAEQRYLTYAEVVSRGIGAYHRLQHYAAAQVEIHDNSPEDILEGTQELHRWYLGDPGYSDEDVRAQRAFTQLFPPEYMGYGTRSRVCASFLRRYRHLMPQASVAVPEGREAVALPS